MISWTVAHQVKRIHGISQARILQWVASSFSRNQIFLDILQDLPDPGIKPRYPTLQEDSLPSESLGKPLKGLIVFVFVFFFFVCIHHIFFIQSSVYGYLICFHIWAIVNRVAMNKGLSISPQVPGFNLFR